MRRYARYLMVCVVAGLLMAGCGASSSKSADTAGNMYQETVTETMAGAAAAPALGRRRMYQKRWEFLNMRIHRKKMT